MNILQQISVSEQMQALRAATEKPGSAAALFGVHRIHRTVAAAAYSIANRCPVILVTESDADAFKAAEDMKAMGFKRVAALPSRELTLMEVEGLSREEEISRLSVFGAAAAGKLDAVCCSVEALCLYSAPSEVYRSRAIKLKKGQTADMRALAARLVSAGYSRCDRVEGRGQFAMRGGILDVFAVDSEKPFRVEFFDDEIDRICEFDPDTQRRTADKGSINISAAREISFGAESAERMTEFMDGLPAGPLKQAVKRDIDDIQSGISPVCCDRYLRVCYDSCETIADYLPDAVLFLCEAGELQQRYKNLAERHAYDMESLASQGMFSKAQGPFYADFGELISKKTRVLCEVFTRAVGDTPLSGIVNFAGTALPRWSGEMSVLCEDLRGYIYGGYRCAVLAATERAARALRNDLEANGIDASLTDGGFAGKGTVAVCVGTISGGFDMAPLKIAVITAGGDGVKSNRKLAARARSAADAFGSLEDLKVGDYVVHRNHGIGRFDGIKRVDHHGYTADYIVIRYRDADTLYVPVTALDLVTPYVAAKEDAKVTLNRLNSGDWQKAKQKVYHSMREMAKELIAIYAKREQAKGIAFSEDTDWQHDFEARFPYDETEDQLRAVDEIKRDMQSHKPMDRLLCGDVGVGKTEVALRAAFKAISDGYQVAVLVPTTILALQHYRTIVERMESYPIKAAMLSRFASAKEQKAAVEGLRAGTVDIVVGTHKLLQKSVEFKKLGLLIIDEEQRFGVAHKEKLKEKFPNVDVLTLSATPIPRTLNMAMSGIRDMSTIEQPPVDRHPIQTYVAEYDENTVVNALRRELARGGQAYYLHNRVESIERTAAKLQELLPDARIGIAHGQMDEEELSRVWKDMIDGECDILVCTTIIETGVDVPNCNTLIVEDADYLGLAQLYQIRGRVGRSWRRAYAWFMFRRDKVLTEISAKRLAAIRDFTSFGSGFKIAMRDLQIRGAGSVLSARQSGHIQNVGYDTYIRILEQAVRDEQGGESIPAPKECRIDLPVSAYIPQSYIPDNESRIEMYKRIADINGKLRFQSVRDELEDRFGPMPDSVRLLCEVASARAGAADLGITEIRGQNGNILLFCENLTDKQLRAAALSLPGRVFYSAKGKKYLTIEPAPGELPLEGLFAVLDSLREASSQGGANLQ